MNVLDVLVILVQPHILRWRIEIALLPFLSAGIASSSEPLAHLRIAWSSDELSVACFRHSPIVSLQPADRTREG